MLTCIPAKIVQCCNSVLHNTPFIQVIYCVVWVITDKCSFTEVITIPKNHVIRVRRVVLVGVNELLTFLKAES
ncbi:unknown [Salmonella phage FelixO1]|uniref:Uncharacterized protein n=1 Tax=Salmonella phage Felix O1 (isolate Felix O1-VT1) TaxID=1283336 RepID=Q6KG69_BPFO1|nr:unknown [Salmonella phage FelixO1]